MPGYSYSARLKAPNLVEFSAVTPQGTRVVWVLLGGLEPRITPFNVSNAQRTPATLFWSEMEELVERAERLKQETLRDND